MWCRDGWVLQYAASPHLLLVDQWQPAYHTTSGIAQFDDGGLIGPCDFLDNRIGQSTLPVSRIDCEIREYIVGTTARLARPQVQRWGPLSRRQRQVSIQPQRVVGIRLTVYCTKADARNYREHQAVGCEPAAWWRNVVNGTMSIPADYVP